MRTLGFRMVCRMLIVSLMLLQFPAARADMVGAEQAARASGVASSGVLPVSAATRAAVAVQLEALGVNGRLAQDRVAALTDAEIRSLEGKVGTLPAGASDGWGWVLLIAIALVVYLNWK